MTEISPQPKHRHDDLRFRLSLRKLQASGILGSKAKELLKLALGRPLVDTSNRKKCRVAESDVIFLRFVLCQLFEVNTELGWRNKPKRFTPEAWRHVWHAEIGEQSGLSRDEIRRKIPRFVALGLIEVDHRRKDDSLEFDGLYMRPNPAKVWELLKRLEPAKKIEREAAQKTKTLKWVPGVFAVVDSPPTPAWLRERALVWRLLYCSNFRAVLPGAIRYHKSGARSRRRIADKWRSSSANVSGSNCRSCPPLGWTAPSSSEQLW
ncbi:MAG: hypothetical protein NT154_24455 [Verrucomicrobia bacterium]|nr:hypothetical protein [Verrucomicrobiota bacterium]